MGKIWEEEGGRLGFRFRFWRSRGADLLVIMWRFWLRTSGSEEEEGSRAMDWLVRSRRVDSRGFGVGDDGMPIEEWMPGTGSRGSASGECWRGSWLSGGRVGGGEEERLLSYGMGNESSL